MTNNRNDLSAWDDLVRRYFEAETSDREEAELREFLLSEEGRSHRRYDEVRAVMGFLSCGKSHRNRNGATVRKHRPAVRLPHARRWAAAAVALLFVLPAVRLLSGTDRDACIAYVGGVKVTDTDAVMAQMHRSWTAVAPDNAAAPSAEEQLNDLFETLEK